jgi:zinc protease
MTQTVRQIRLPNGLPLTQYRLANGLTLYVIENSQAPVFHLQTWFNVGSRDEKLDSRLDCTGLAHLFEHMMFRGTPRYPDGEFDEILARNGAQDQNATTWLDRTNYFASLPSSRLDLLLELEADRMVNLAIDKELLDTEREAVLGEYRMGLDDPATVAYEHLYAQAFTAHPYRYTTIGTEAEIQGFGVDDANYFYRKFYSPNNATLMVAGAVRPDETLRLVEKHYGAFKPQKVEKLRAPIEPPQTSERRFEFTHTQLTEPKLLIGYHTPEVRHADQAALWVLDSVLTTGWGSKLQEAWVDTGLTVGVGGSLDQFQDPGLQTLMADLQPGKSPEQVLAALDRVLQGLDSPSLANDVERARNQLLLAIYPSWSRNEGLLTFMGEFISAAGDPLYAFEQIEAVERVTSEDVLRVARKYLISSNRTVVVGRGQES